MDDTSKLGIPCSGSGVCSLTVFDEPDNTVMRRTTCMAGPLTTSQFSILCFIAHLFPNLLTVCCRLPIRTNVYQDATCSSSAHRSSFGYDSGCFAGSLNGLSKAGSSRYACDAQGNTFTITYSGSECTGTALTCSRLNSGPAGDACVPYIYGINLWQKAKCTTPSTNIPALCYPIGGLPVPTTTAPPTTRPAANYDLNRDGVINTLDLVYLMDNFGPCKFGAECRADIAVPYGVVNNYDLIALYNVLPQ
jgi:hypothetical protein